MWFHSSLISSYLQGLYSSPVHFDSSCVLFAYSAALFYAVIISKCELKSDNFFAFSVDIPDGRIRTTNAETGETTRRTEESASIRAAAAVEASILARLIVTRNSPKRNRQPRLKWRPSRKQKSRSHKQKFATSTYQLFLVSFCGIFVFFKFCTPFDTVLVLVITDYSHLQCLVYETI